MTWGSLDLVGREEGELGNGPLQVWEGEGGESAADWGGHGELQAAGHWICRQGQVSRDYLGVVRCREDTFSDNLCHTTE